MKSLAALLAAAFFACQLAARAQEPATAPTTCPPDPVAKQVPDDMRWVVRTSAAGQTQETGVAAGPQASGAVSTGEKQGKVYHIVTSAQNGVRFESWNKDGVRVMTSSEWKEPEVVVTPPDDPLGPVAWVSPKNFTGFQEVGSKPYMIFRKTEIDPRFVDSRLGATESNAPTIELKAVVDYATRLPLAMQVGPDRSDFEFTKMAPGEKLAVPANVQAEFAKHQEFLDRQAQRAARP